MIFMGLLELRYRIILLYVGCKVLLRDEGLSLVSYVSRSTIIASEVN